MLGRTADSSDESSQSIWFCIGERNMTSVGRESYPAISSEAAEEMARYDITRVPVDYFHYGDFRYTNLKDAVAQAKRQQRQEEGARSPGGGRSRS